MIGFLPGFAYMGDVDRRIALPRKKEPRLQIDEGCVGIAGQQTGIIPNFTGRMANNWSYPIEIV